MFCMTMETAPGNHIKCADSMIVTNISIVKGYNHCNVLCHDSENYLNVATAGFKGFAQF